MQRSSAGAVAGLRRPGREPQRDQHADQALLSTVAEIAFDTPPGVIGGLDDPSARLLGTNAREPPRRHQDGRSGARCRASGRGAAWVDADPHLARPRPSRRAARSGAAAAPRRHRRSPREERSRTAEARSPRTPRWLCRRPARTPPRRSSRSAQVHARQIGMRRRDPQPASDHVQATAVDSQQSLGRCSARAVRLELSSTPPEVSCPQSVPNS
jgi:hypothetical protein